jgi:hypothetical protein
MGNGDFQPEHFYGHCKKYGKPGYMDIQEPFGVTM